MSNEKRQYLIRLQNLMTGLASNVHVLEDLELVYNARQYGVGGTNEITVEELAEMEMTPNDLQLAIYLCHNLVEFLNGRPIFASNYVQILNEIRTDI